MSGGPLGFGVLPGFRPREHPTIPITVSLDQWYDDKKGEYPAKFRFKGWTTGDHWNGWETPWFESAEAMRLLDAMNEGRTGVRHGFDPATDTFKFWDDGGEEWEEFKGETVLGRKLYAIGAYSWVWTEV